MFDNVHMGKFHMSSQGFWFEVFSKVSQTNSYSLLISIKNVYSIKGMFLSLVQFKIIQGVSHSDLTGTPCERNFS